MTNKPVGHADDGSRKEIDCDGSFVGWAPS